MLQKLEKNFPIQPIVDQTLSYKFDRYLQLNETSGGLFNGPYTIKAEYKNTPLGNVLESMGNIGEARLLKLTPEESYMAHSDPDDRWHLSIITNPYSYVMNLETNEMFHIPADGHLYLMDTGPVHVATNFGSRDRIHLNVRVLLPDVDNNPVRFIVHGGDFDWKHVIQVSISRWLNRAIKEGRVLGLRKIHDREILFNPLNDEVLKELVYVTEQAGFTCTVTT